MQQIEAAVAVAVASTATMIGNELRMARGIDAIVTTLNHDC